MELRAKEQIIEVPQDQPFRDDKLNRASIAGILTSIVNAYSITGSVIAIDGEWGAGKTTFVRMWKQELENNGYKTLYFNAWETDHFDDPLIAILGELSEVFKSNKEFKSLASKAGRITLRASGEILKGCIKKATGINTEAIAGAIDEISDIFSEGLKSYSLQKAEFCEFKKQLEEFIASEAIENNHPVVFFIDELDRCNPHYAIKLLERIKHLFEVPNIIFVLAVNINQLKYAIQGFYGSSNIDGEEYLKRFIDLQYSLPCPNLETFINHLYNYHNFDSFFGHQIRQGDHRLRYDGEMFLRIATALLSHTPLNLRSINKIFAYTRIVLQSFPLTSKISADLLFLLCFFKVITPAFYSQLKMRKFSLQELVDEIENILPPSIFISTPYFHDGRTISWATANLLLSYNSNEHRQSFEDIFKVEKFDNQPLEYPITTKRFPREDLFEALSYYINHNEYYSYGLEQVYKKIDLLQVLNM